MKKIEKTKKGNLVIITGNSKVDKKNKEIADKTGNVLDQYDFDIEDYENVYD